MEEVWLERFPGEDSSVHLQDIPETPADWKNPALAAKWDKIRRARSVVTGALEIERQNKVIGSSLEAVPTVYVKDAEILKSIDSVPFEDICITSNVIYSQENAPAGAFALPESPGVAVVFAHAEGEKCQRCWKILPDVGTHTHAGVCGRCDEALG